MNKSRQNFISIPAKSLGSLLDGMEQYCLLLLGEDLSKDKMDAGLKHFESDKDKNGLSGLFAEQEVKAVGVLKTKDLPDFEKELELIHQKVDFDKSFFMVLVEYKSSFASEAIQRQSSENAFLISSNAFIEFYENQSPKKYCYHFALKAIDQKNGVLQILVHQMRHPNPIFIKSTSDQVSAEIIMPHRGNLDDLKSAHWHLQNQNTAPPKISICYDEFVDEAHFTFADEQPDTRFFASFPSGVGPYVSRDILARNSEEKVLIFHDSDDVSTKDRVAVLNEALKGEDFDAIGSHELRIDKIQKKVHAFRFPIDALKFENDPARRVIFFPTSAIKQKAFVKIGGLSRLRKFSSDTQFYMRAHFFLNMKNVDEFLYIRVRHENSLTTAPGTDLGAVARTRLWFQWQTDYLRIKFQNISLLNSTLIDDSNPVEVDLIALKKENRATILDWQKLKQSIDEKKSFKFQKPAFPDEGQILAERLADYKEVTDPGIQNLKNSFSWKIGWKITRLIIALFGWIPFVKKRIK